jgi:hypothetical protein
MCSSVAPQLLLSCASVAFADLEGMSIFDDVEISAHLRASFVHFNSFVPRKFLMIGHALRSDVDNDADTMTGKIIQKLRDWNVEEITLLPISQAPCRTDGYVLHRTLNADISCVAKCLLPFVQFLIEMIHARKVMLLGDFAHSCVSAALVGHEAACLEAKISHPCRWENVKNLDIAFEALSARLSGDFMTKEQLIGVVKHASRTPHRENIPRSEEALSSTSRMGNHHTLDMANRRAELQIGTNVEDVRRRLLLGQKLVQICHEMCVTSNALMKTISNKTNSHEKEILVQLKTTSNDLDVSRLSAVDVNFLTFARELGFSAFTLSILNPLPVSWKDVRIALNLKGNTARETESARLSMYEDSTRWLSTSDLLRLIAGSKSSDRVARVLLPAKSASLREWIAFVDAVVLGEKEAHENPRAMQSYLSPAARKRRRLENAEISASAVP